ncbi:MAG TPA: sialate O-acetylesterase [Chitinophagaceae bacterium]
MKKILRSTLLSLLALSFSVTALADVRLPAILGDHMVLQQSTEVQLWGWCDPNERIEIRTGWDTTTYRTTGTAAAKWSVKVKTGAAGGPYTIHIKGNNTVQVNDVLLGEVWLGSGQSNMEMHYNWGVKRYTGAMDSATNQSIRLFHVPRLTAAWPQDDLKGRWVVCTPEEAKRFSMVAYFFGQKLQQELNVPVGLIASSWGGTPAEVWTPADTVSANSVLREAAAKINPSPHWPITPGATYNAMIHPLTPFTIAGVLWYQGESNVGTWSAYRPLLTSLITSWRSAWNKELPFYYVQIAPFSGYGTGNDAALLREAQAGVQAVPHTGMVVTHDLVDDVKDIHPQNKKDVALRLAAYALAEVYGKTGFAYKTPQYSRLQVEKDRVRLYFEGAEKGLVSKGPLRDFYMAGEDRQFVPASAKIDGNTVVVWSKSVKKPVAVRYGFSSAAMPNLYTKDGLPVAIFRTDSWTETPKLVTK